MKMRLSLVIVAAAAAAGCAVPGGSTRTHGGGAVVPVWVYEGYLSVGEEPIHRKANDNAPVIFKLDNDSETALYKFPADAFEFIQPTSEFTCATQAEDTMVKCFRTGNLRGEFKYKLSVVSRTDPEKRPKLDPFIITH